VNNHSSVAMSSPFSFGALQPHICGCHYYQDTFPIRKYLPQIQLISHTTITPLSFTTELTQTFQNSSEASIKNARYTFPLYDGVAVNKFTITFGNEVLHGVVKQKDDAKQIFQAAVDRNETAGLLESLPAGIFGMTVGNIPAKTDVIVQITYGGELKHDAAIEGLRYTLPTSIAPRYGSYPGEAMLSSAVANGGIKISVDLDMASSAIRKIQSPSHPISVELGQLNNASSASGELATFNPSLASATLALTTAELAEDFVLQVLVDNINQPQAILEVHPTLKNQRAIMATLVPKFALKPAHPEIVFIADQSGSMMGEKNEALVSALKIFIKSLPFGVRFNICAFGNGFEFLWPRSQAYNEENVTNAIRYVEGFEAQRGGTEILGPIKAAFENRLADMSLEVMLLTDGQVWREMDVFSYVNEQIRDKKANARVFAMGVGSDVSHSLVEGVARAGNGFSQFVAKSEETSQKVMRMLKSALYAHTRDYALEVHYEKTEDSAAEQDDDFELVEKVDQYLHIKHDESSNDSSQMTTAVEKPMSFFDTSVDNDAKPTEQPASNRYAHLPAISTPEILQAPSDIPPLFPYSRTTIYLLLGPESAQREVVSVTLRASSDAGPLELNLPVKQISKPGTTIHQLAARKAVQELEEGRGWVYLATTMPAEGDGAALVREKYSSRFDEIVEREAVALGQRFQVASKWTSFVAVNEKSKDELQPPAVSVGADTISPSGKMRAMRGGGGGSFGATGGLFGMPAPSASPAPPEQRERRYFQQPGGFTSNQFARKAMMTAPPAVASRGPIQACMFTAPNYAPPAPSYGQANAFSGAGIIGSANAAPPQIGGFGSSSISRSAQPGASPSGFGSSRSFPSVSSGNDGGLSSGGGLFSASPAAAAPPPPPSQQAGAGALFGAPPKQASASRDDPMQQVIGKQKFFGCWHWEDDFFATMGINHNGVDVNDFGGDKNIAATALTIAWLRRVQKDDRDVWEFVVAKAEQWLSACLPKKFESVDALVAKALEILPSKIVST
jgi:hypothetical protein